jgi:hypothetical protein
MRGIILIALLLMSMVVKAQTDFDTSTDKENGSVVFKGQITYNDLRKEPSLTKALLIISRMVQISIFWENT